MTQLLRIFHHTLGLYVVDSIWRTFIDSEIMELVSICPYIPTRNALWSNISACSAITDNKENYNRIHFCMRMCINSELYSVYDSVFKFSV